SKRPDKRPNAKSTPFSARAKRFFLQCVRESFSVGRERNSRIAGVAARAFGHLCRLHTRRTQISPHNSPLTFFRVITSTRRIGQKVSPFLWLPARAKSLARNETPLAHCDDPFFLL